MRCVEPVELDDDAPDRLLGFVCAHPPQVATRPSGRRPGHRSPATRLHGGASEPAVVADITEFPTGEGKLHLAAIRDLCHRGIVGWSMDEHQDLRRERPRPTVRDELLAGAGLALDAAAWRDKLATAAAPGRRRSPTSRPALKSRGSWRGSFSMARG